MAVPDHWRETAPGLAGLRTALAWQRSLLLVVVTGIALAKYAANGGQLLAGAVVGTLLIGVALALCRRTARGQVGAPSWGAHRRRNLQALTTVTVLAAGLSLVTVVLLG